ncbi:MAG: DMT family transporter [Candidatus Bipolaricaulis sp.]|nr:DMT family transporter [Candidatus Bipolaricaulis sp.]
MPGRSDLYTRIAIGLLAVSSGSILVRLAPDAAPLAAAAWRLVLASLVLLPIAWVRGGLATLRRRDVALAAASGIALALHFTLWFTSLRHTSVASSVLLVSTHPLFVALGSVLFLRERIGRALAAGIVVALLGGLVIGFADLRLGTQTVVGDLLAVGGGICFAVYVLIGRSLQRAVAFVDYVAVSYGVAGIIVLCAAIAVRQPLVGFQPASYAYLILLALGPQLVGHSTLNWALRHLSASNVSALALGEPVGAAILAYAVFGEVPSWQGALGAVTILFGIFISQRSKEATRESRGRSSEDRVG